MTRERIAPESDREQIRAMLQQRWRQQVAVTYFDMRKVVVTRRALVGRILVVILALPVVIPWILVLAAADTIKDLLETFGVDVGPDAPTQPAPKRRRWYPRNGRTFTVSGGKSSMARHAGAVIKDAGPDVWFAWSAGRAALLGNGQIRWEGAGPSWPQVDLVGAKLRWADGSSATFEDFGDAEKIRIRAWRGYP